MPKTKKKEGAARKRLVLLDTHAIIHRAYHALPPLTSPQGEPVGAVYGLTTMLMKLVKDLRPDYLVAAYDLPGPTHRHEVYKEYKGKRPKLDDELVSQINRSREVLAAFGIPVIEAPGFEADDIIGTLATSLKKKYDIVIASGDMDTLQLVDGTRVQVYTLRKGIQDTVLYDEDAVVERYGFGPKQIPDYKGIAGDTSDNIIGIPGIGEKGATELLKVFGTVENIYKALKKNPQALVAKGFKERLQGLVVEHEDEAEFSKVLATIRTDAPVTVPLEKTYSEVFDVEKVVELCNTFGFRSLIARVRATESSRVSEESKAAPTHAPTQLFGEDEALYKECVVMVWLLNSETTNPGLDDIYAMTGEKDLKNAHARLLSQLSKERLDDVYAKIEKPLIPVIDAINRTGVLIDAPYLKGLSKEYHQELDRRAAAIYKAAGVEFNINSPKQLGDVLFTKLGLSSGGRQKKTSTGQLSTKESELQKLASTNPIVGEILAYRELNKLLGTYIDAIPPLLDSAGRLHTTFSQTGAATGRLSSRDPGLQNIPIKTELGRRIRRGFVAAPGKVLLACDYSQIELRLAAILSGDEKLTDIFTRGEDVHAAVAAQVFGVPQSEVTKEMRRRAKVINFGILYGMGVNALRENLGTDRAEAQAFYTKYFDTYTGLAQYLEKTKATAARTGYTTTLFGRKRYFPGMKSKLPFIRASAERMAINAPLQGTQSDIIKIAMVRIHDLFEKEFAGKAAIVLQIHDELIVEVAEGELGRVAEKTKEIMEGVLTRAETNGIPILVSSEAGPNWAEMQPL